MNNERIKNLEKWIEEEPNEPFNKFALALELIESQPNKSTLLFDELLTYHSEYLPTYYIASSFFTNRGYSEKSISILKSGIKLAQEQHNAKTLRELKSALEQLEF